MTIVIAKRSLVTRQVITEYLSLSSASKDTGVKLSRIREACKTSASHGRLNKSMGRVGGFHWTKHHRNPLKFGDTCIEDAVYSTCAACVGLDGTDQFMSEDQKEEIRNCPCTCRLKPYRDYQRGVGK